MSTEYGIELEVGRLYRFRGRNLSAGVWNGVNFVGLRNKFGLRLDSCETPNTIRDIEATELKVPYRIGTAESFSRCGLCSMPVHFVREPETVRGWHHIDLEGMGAVVDLDDDYEDHKVRPVGRTNWELFIWLYNNGGLPT